MNRDASGNISFLFLIESNHYRKI